MKAIAMSRRVAGDVQRRGSRVGATVVHARTDRIDDRFGERPSPESRCLRQSEQSRGILLRHHVEITVGEPSRSQGLDERTESVWWQGISLLAQIGGKNRRC